MPELSLCPIFTTILTIIGAVSGIWGIITFFIQIKDDHKIKIFKRTAAFLLVGIICVVTGLVLKCENDQTAAGKAPASGTADLSKEILDNDVGASEPDVEDMKTPEPPLDDPEPDAPGTNDSNRVNEDGSTKEDGMGSGNDREQIPDSNMSDTVQSTTPESPALPPVTVDQVTLNYTSTELTVGEAVSLLATVSYSDGKTGYNAVWRSSNPVVASVDSTGTVTALSAGTTQITAQASENNVSASAECIITVVNPPSVPTGYSIRLSTDHAILGETFKLYVEPYEDDVTQIQIYTISPSGLHDDFPLSADGKYLIDTETGRWQIYASVTNAAGTYMAHRPEDYVEIEIQGVEDVFSSIIQGLI